MELRRQPAAVEVEVAADLAVDDDAPGAQPVRLVERQRPAGAVALDGGRLVDRCVRRPRPEDQVPAPAGLPAMADDVGHQRGQVAIIELHDHRAIVPP
jgi:hypothetical protein